VIGSTVQKLTAIVRGNVRMAAISVLAIMMGLFHIYTAGFRPLPAIQQRALHLSFALGLTFLIFPFTRRESTGKMRKRAITGLDAMLVLLSFAIGAYVWSEYHSIILRLAYPTFLDSAVSLLAIALVLEATRRAIGWSMIVICFGCFAYLAAGEHLPVMLGHTGFTLERVSNFMFLTTEGIMGTAIGVSATVIVTFILFGSFLEQSGTGRLFVDSAYALFGRFKGGPAKAAVVGSTLFGMITGSQVANVVAIGVFTIPMMKRAGYKPEMAGAIEAVASTGAMIMPPVMGAAAFIIPEFLGCSYFDVVKAAFIPALLFYTVLYVYVEIQASKLGILGLPKAELPSISKLLREYGHMAVPVLVLIYFLAIEMSSAPRAAFWAIMASLLVSAVRKNTRMGLGKLRKAFEGGAKGTVIVANACASAGIITGTIAITGMGLRFSDALITVAGGSLVALLLLAMIASLIIGLPLPPVSCYLILAVLAAPAMIKMGVHPMAAHLFVFYFGILGNISPPVAPTSFAAAGLAGSNPFKTTNLAFVISSPAWLVPYLFVYGPALMLYGSIFEILSTILSSFVGVSCLAMALQGRLFRDFGWIFRIITFMAGLFLVVPGFLTDLVGYGLLGIVVVHQIVTSPKGARIRL
jgi:TRAP transporter 4TM/12TM fusion protein